MTILKPERPSSMLLRFSLIIIFSVSGSIYIEASEAAIRGCETRTSYTSLTLSNASMSVPAGTSLGSKYDGGEQCTDSDLENGVAVPISDRPVGVVGADGYQQVVPGLSVKATIDRTSNYGRWYDGTASGGITHSTGPFGGQWPNTPRSGDASLGAYFAASVTYRFRREAGMLVPGDHVTTIGQIMFPSGSRDFALKVHIPGGTCNVLSKHLKVNLAPAGIGLMNALAVGETLSSGTRFNIELDCNAAKNLTLTFTDPHSAVGSMYLKPGPGSTAAGVALELQNGKDGAHIRPGQAIDVPNSTSSTRLSPEFIVKYVKTENRVEAGLVAATANFMIDYE